MNLYVTKVLYMRFGSQDYTEGVFIIRAKSLKDAEQKALSKFDKVLSARVIECYLLGNAMQSDVLRLH